MKIYVLFMIIVVISFFSIGCFSVDQKEVLLIEPIMDSLLYDSNIEGGTYLMDTINRDIAHPCDGFSHEGKVVHTPALTRRLSMVLGEPICHVYISNAWGERDTSLIAIDFVNRKDLSLVYSPIKEFPHAMCIIKNDSISPKWYLQYTEGVL